MKKTQDQIHYNMSRIRNKDTGIEVSLRKELWSRGLRYRKNDSRTFGHPDIAFISRKVVVFCDSEFWHGFDWEKRKNEIKTNQEYWIPKIERNIQRDKEVNEKLREQGWTVLRYWGREIEKNLSGCADEIEKAVRGK